MLRLSPRYQSLNFGKSWTQRLCADDCRYLVTSFVTVETVTAVVVNNFQHRQAVALGSCCLIRQLIAPCSGGAQCEVCCAWHYLLDVTVLWFRLKQTSVHLTELLVHTRRQRRGYYNAVCSIIDIHQLQLNIYKMFDLFLQLFQM